MAGTKKSPAAAETTQAKKTVKTVKTKKTSEGHKKRTRRRIETFALYIYKVLK